MDCEEQGGEDVDERYDDCDRRSGMEPVGNDAEDDGGYEADCVGASRN